MIRALIVAYRLWRDPALCFSWPRAWRTARRVDVPAIKSRIVAERTAKAEEVKKETSAAGGKAVRK